MKILNKVFFAMVTLSLSSASLAATFTVTNNLDSGPGSLRQALMDLNATCSGLDNIVFNIPASANPSNFSIALSSPLPMVQCKVKIDGFSQPGAAAGSPLIELSGTALSATIVPATPSSSGFPAGLVLASRDKMTGAMLPVNPDGSEISGLIINRFPLHGIYLYGTNNVSIKGNYFGIDVTGEQPGFANRSRNILLEGAKNTRITDRNLIATAVLFGVDMIWLNNIGFHPQSLGNCASCPQFNTIGASDNVIQNNYFGLNKEGNCTVGGFRANGVAGLPGSCQPNGTRLPGGDTAAVYSLNTGIIIERGIGNAFTDPSTAHNKNNLIGGLEAGQGNVISGTRAVGTVLHGPLNKVQGNIYGLRADATRTGMPTTGQAQISVAAHGYGNVIENNTISNAALAGIALIELGYHPGPRNVVIKGNYVGINKQGTAGLGNGLHGVFVGADSADVLIENNTIANNSFYGITVRPRTDPAGTYTPTGVSILTNSIYNNGRIGIDLNPIAFVGVPADVTSDGVTANDALDADGSSNNLQNHPVIDAQKSFVNPALVQVWGKLDSKPNKTYLIQAFASRLADPSGSGEGQIFVGEYIVNTDTNGHVDFHFPAAINAPQVLDPATNQMVTTTIISATATDLETGDTSEFSPWVNVGTKGSGTAFENSNGSESNGNVDGLYMFDLWE